MCSRPELSKQSCPIPREYGPANLSELARTDEVRLRALGCHINPNHVFKVIKIPNARRAPIGIERAKPISFVELVSGSNTAASCKDKHQLNQWMARKPAAFTHIWKPGARVTMESDMPSEIFYNMNEHIGDPSPLNGRNQES